MKHSFFVIAGVWVSLSLILGLDLVSSAQDKTGIDQTKIPAPYSATGLTVTRHVGFVVGEKNEEATITTPVVGRSDAMYLTPEMAAEAVLIAKEIRSYISDCEKLKQRGEVLAQRWEKVKEKAITPSVPWVAPASPTPTPIPTPTPTEKAHE